MHFVHIDKMADDMVMVHNTLDHEVSISLDGEYKGIFTDAVSEGKVYTAPAGSAEILVRG